MRSIRFPSNHLHSKPFKVRQRLYQWKDIDWLICIYTHILPWIRLSSITSSNGYAYIGIVFASIRQNTRTQLLINTNQFEYRISIDSGLLPESSSSLPNRRTLCILYILCQCENMHFQVFRMTEESIHIKMSNGSE